MPSLVISASLSIPIPDPGIGGAAAVVGRAVAVGRSVTSEARLAESAQTQSGALSPALVVVPSEVL